MRVGYVCFCSQVASHLWKEWLIVFLALGTGTILLLLLSDPGVVHAQGAYNGDLRAYDFASDVYTRPGRGRLKGIMATDGRRHRIAVYWADSGRVRDNMSLVSSCDVILSEEGARFWMQGFSEAGVIRWSDKTESSLLPCRNDAPAVIRSALGIIHWLRRPLEADPNTLHLRRFVHDSRMHPAYTYGYPLEDHNEVGISHSANTMVTDKHILNDLP